MSTLSERLDSLTDLEYADGTSTANDIREAIRAVRAWEILVRRDWGVWTDQGGRWVAGTYTTIAGSGDDPVTVVLSADEAAKKLEGEK